MAFAAPTPFTTTEPYEGQYGVTANIESPEMLAHYLPLFEAYGYTGNGYSWEGHIQLMLEELAPELLDKIEFDPEAGAFFMYTEEEAVQQRFLQLLTPIFQDRAQLIAWLEKADPDAIDD